MMTNVMIILLLLQIKHLVVDWLWQPPYEWQNKGTYGHFGGIRHAGKNAIGTMICFIPFVPSVSILATVLVADFLVHYHVDWFKMNINRIKGWGPTTHAEFWYLTGLDQFAHQCCYIFLIWIAVGP